MQWLKYTPVKTLSQLDLEPGPGEMEKLNQGLAEKGVKTKSGFVLPSNLPTVSIGQPDILYLPKVVDNQTLSVEIQKQLKNEHIYLLRFPCSFRPKYNQFTIQHAIFGVNFVSFTKTGVAVFDIDPKSIDRELKKTRRMVIDPSFKFMDFEMSVGEFVLGLEYPELQPVISGTGIGETYPCWEYTAYEGQTITGSKLMHVLVKSAHPLSEVNVHIVVEAELKTQGSLVKAIGMDRSRRKDMDILRVNLVP